ncbi:GDP-mannose transporter GONST5 [Gracilariopsis chorda]|uniref:GDP-mannose transporter GONST5 n=1 Tax=Gracilariopsis chorda TaxID=448386 RepID=A0A2V3J487_9FLOR|nr:GDP-mannose transporter GONST5 [Gracilariopsis chorda]|eukprot:PXF48807.1 GDP-mannose transporter GONST5 [Gracilariopsis chorda]
MKVVSIPVDSSTDPSSKSDASIAPPSPTKPPLVVFFFIICWFLANGTTVLLNKYIFKTMHFTNPLCLTLIHMTTQSILAHLTIDYFKSIDKVRVDPIDYYSKLLVIAAVFCTNICLGNISLRFVPVSFMQTIKSLTPVCTALLQYLVFRSRLRPSALMALIPISGGVALASVTELEFHLGGFIAALTACFLTGLKFVLSSQMLAGRYKLDSINLLYYMAPPSVAILLPLVFFFEKDGVVSWFAHPERSNKDFLLLLFSGLVSYVLNVTLFIVLKATSSVTVTVAGNIKTVIVIGVSIIIFQNAVTWVNLLGCMIAIAGCCWYGLIKDKWATMGTLDLGKAPSTYQPVEKSEKLPQ